MLLRRNTTSYLRPKGRREEERRRLRLAPHPRLHQPPKPLEAARGVLAELADTAGADLNADQLIPAIAASLTTNLSPAVLVHLATARLRRAKTNPTPFLLGALQRWADGTDTPQLPRHLELDVTFRRIRELVWDVEERFPELGTDHPAVQAYDEWVAPIYEAHGRHGLRDDDPHAEAEALRTRLNREDVSRLLNDSKPMLASLAAALTDPPRSETTVTLADLEDVL